MGRTAKDLGLNGAPLRNLTEDEITAYEQDGAAVVRGVLGQEWIEYMAAAMDRILANPAGIGSADYNADPEKGRFYNEIFTWTRDEDFRALVFDSPLAEIAAQAMRSEVADFFYDQLFVKEPGTVEPTPWHQDLPYWPVQGSQIISVWLPLDPVTPDSGGVAYIKGSHRWGKMFMPVSFNSNPEVTEHDAVFETEFDELPDVDADPDKYIHLCWEMEPGDCILHHPLTLHGSRGNATRTLRRRAVAMRFTGDDARYLERELNFIDAVVGFGLMEDHGLRSGDRFGKGLFPRVWPRA